MKEMALALRLARRELREGLRGFGVFIACLALGVAAIASVQSVSRAVLTSLAEDGRAILGGDVAVRQIYQTFTDDERTAFREAGTVSEQVEIRAMARPPRSETATLVELKAVDGAYPLYGRVELQPDTDLGSALAPRDGRWGAVVETGVLDRLGLAIGDRLLMGDAEFEIRATIVREPDRIAAGTVSLAPRVLTALPAVQAAGLLRPGALVYWNTKIAFSDPKADPTVWGETLRARFPQASWRVHDMANASPQLAGFIGRLADFLTLVGLTALLVGGVGVGNAVRAHLDRRAGTVATLKCLGAPARLVTLVFLFQILALAVVGTVIGLAVGAVAPLLAGSLLGEVLPIPVRVGLQAPALAQAAVFGLLTAFAFSVWPLGRAMRISGAALFRDRVAPSADRPGGWAIAATAAAVAALAVFAVLTADNRMIALSFVVAAAFTFAVFRGAAVLIARVAARVRGLASPALRLAVAALHRPGSPAGAVVLSLGLGLTVLVAVADIQGNFTERVTESLPAEAPSFFLIDIQPDQMEPLRTLVGRLPGATDLRAVPSLRGRIATVNGREADQALVNRERSWILDGDRGLTYAAEPPVGGEILAGAWWPADYSGPPKLAIDANVAEAFGIGPGARVGVNVLGREVEAEVALVRRVDFSRMQINFTLVFSPGVLEAAPKTFIATLRSPADAEAATQRAILAAFPNVTAITVRDALGQVAEVIGRIGTAVRATAGVTLLAGVLVLAGAMAAGHERRVYEAVVLKVLGATRGDVLRAFLYEHGLLGLATALVAAGLGTFGAWAVLTFVMRWDWSFQPMAVAWTIGIGLGATLAFGFLGTWRALGRSAAPLLRNE